MSVLRRPDLILLDLDGTLTRGRHSPPVEGALEAVARLRRLAPIRFVTNTTSQPLEGMRRWLRELGLLQADEELVMPVLTARRLLPERGHAAGLLLVDATARPDYDWFELDPQGPAVLLGSESHQLRIAELQPLVRRLLDGACLYTLERNRYFRQGEQLVTDLGPLAAFLEYAAGVEAHNLGKPSRLLYAGLAKAFGLELGQLLMVGDDAEFDASGAVALGMQGVLVRGGKYRPGDERRVDPSPTLTLDTLEQLAARLETLA